MENASKALTMAASTLLAVMILVVIVYFFNNISAWPKQQDDMETAEQIAKFNKEYEVYDKKMMYGVDVISCLNKAKSNDEKYVEGGGFLTGDTYGTPYLIDVSVKIKNVPEESVEIYYIDVDGKQKQLFDNDVIIRDVNGTTKLKYEDIFDISSGMTHLNKSGNIDFKVYTGKLNGTNEFKANETYYLLKNNKVDKDSALYKLLEQSNNIRQIQKNSKKNLNRVVEDINAYPLVDKYYGWSSAIWNTALYDLKKRKFKCTNIEYSSDTGRITAIHFEEI